MTEMSANGCLLFQPGYCTELVMSGFHPRPCSRKEWKGGWCKQHHPDTVAERRKKSDDAYAEKYSPIRKLKRQLEEKTEQYDAMLALLEVIQGIVPESPYRDKIRAAIAKAKDC